MTRILLLSLAALFAPLALGQSCQVLVNCSFEIPALPKSGYQYNPTAAGTVWTFSSNSGIQRNGSAWHATTAPDGVQTAFIQGISALSQTVTLAAGDYTLSFEIAQRHEGVAPYIQPIRVMVDGAQIGSLISPTTTSFVAVSVPFTVTSSGSHTIAFFGTDPADKTAFIEDVSVQSSGSPPPPPSGSSVFTSVESTSPPNDSVPVDSLVAGNGASNVDVALVPKGTGAILAQVPDSTVAAGSKRGPLATDFQRARLYFDDVASGYGATISGGANSVASGVYATVVGGYDNEASGDVAIVGGHSSVASGAGSPVAFGFNANATGDSGVALGHDPEASGTDSVAIGRQNVAARDNSVAIGWDSVSDATQSMALGTQATTRGIHGAVVFAAGQIAARGDAQHGIYILKTQTVDATPTQLTTDAVTVSLSRANILVLPDQASYAFGGRVVARDIVTGDSASWKFEGMVKRGSGASTTTQVSTVSMVAGDAGASTWTFTLLGDTANGALALRGTGQAGKTIRWVASVETVENAP